MTTRKQSALSRFAGNTNFLMGALRRIRGAVLYLPFAPTQDDEYLALRYRVIQDLDKMERYVREMRRTQHATIRLEQDRDKHVANELEKEAKEIQFWLEKANGKASDDAQG